MRRKVIALLVFCLLSAGVGSTVRVSSRLVDALPSDGATGAALADAERFSLLDTLWFEIDGTGVPADALHAAIDQLGARLEASGEFTSVRSRFDIEDGVALRKAAGPSLVLLTDEGTLATRLSAAGMRAALSRAQARLFAPGGSMAAGQIEADPLDLGGEFTTRALAGTAGANTRLVNGHLLSSHGEHGLLFARASTPALGTTLDSPLVTHVRAALAASPLPANWLGSHRYAAEAEHMIRGAVNLAVTAGMGLVALVFLLAFRSLRPLLGTIAPTLVGALTAGAAAVLVSPIHGLSLAFGGALAGMGVDYWIHLYVTGLREPVPATFPERLARGRESLDHLLSAYLISVTATATAFLMLTTSSYPAVADLGVIGIGVALGALGTIILVGPLLFALIARPGDRVPRVPLPTRVPGWVVTAVLFSTVFLGLRGADIRFDGDPRAMDARLPETAAFQAEFEERFGEEGTTGVVVAEGTTVDAALERLLPAARVLADAPGISLQAPLSLLPAPSQRAAREKLAADPGLSDRFAIEAAAMGFEPATLLPGFSTSLATLLQPTLDTWNGTVAADMLSRTVDVEGHAVAAIVSAVTQEALDHARHEVEFSGAHVRFVHPAGAAAEGAERVKHELLTRSGAALLAVLALLALRYRDVPKILAAALPSLAAAAGTLGVLALCDVALTPVSGPAFVLILGVAFDQGIFLVEAGESRDQNFHAARAAIVIALSTAFAGFAGLLFADYPAVWGLGVVVSLGIGFTALGTFAGVPAILTPSGQLVARRWAGRLATIGALGLALDTVTATAGWLRPPPTPDFRTYDLVNRSPTERAYGPNRMVRVHSTWLMRLEGTAWEIGRASAVLAGDLRRADEAALVEEFSTKVPSRLLRYLLIRGLPLFAGRMAAEVPASMLEEIAGGMSIEGADDFAWLGPAYTRNFCYHAIHDVGQAMVDNPIAGCTGFAAGGSRTTDGHWIAARNWDFDGGRFFDENKAVIVVKREGAIPFVHVAIAGLVGSVSGVNDAGIGVAVLAAGSDAPIRFDTPMTFIIREILESATSLSEVQHILDERRGFVSENVLVIDGEHGEAAVFEVTPADVYRLEGGEAVAVANHLRGPHAGDGQNQLRMAEGTTVARLARMEELIQGGVLDEPRAIAILRDRAGVGGKPLPYGHESAINADITSHGVVIDATARTVAVSRYPNTSGGFTRFSLRGVLDGRMAGEDAAPPDAPEVAFRTHAAREALASPSIASAQRALRLAPGNPEALLALGEAQLASGQRAEAGASLAAAVATPLAHAADQRKAAALLEEASR